MKIATYNIQSLFHRHIDLVLDKKVSKMEIWEEEFDRLLVKPYKSLSEIKRLTDLSALLDFDIGNTEPKISLRKIDGNLFATSEANPKKLSASPLTDWNGHIQLSSIPVTKRSFENKARVILEADADILILQEVESRNSLMQLNNLYLVEKMSRPYKSIFHMAGNDCRDMGMGLLLKKGLYLKSIKTFANEVDKEDNFTFENDLQLYKIEVHDGSVICVLNCHFSSVEPFSELQFSRRKSQLRRISEIYQGLWQQDYKNIVVAGTLNVPSYSAVMSPVMEKTDLKNSVSHSSFSVELDRGLDSGYYRMGAYGKGVNVIQNDYLMFSPDIFDRVIKSGLNRKAMWPLKEPRWPLYGTIMGEKDAASEHPLIWAEINFQESMLNLRRSA